MHTSRVLGQGDTVGTRMVSAFGTERPRAAFGQIRPRTFRGTEIWKLFSSFLEEDDAIDDNKHLDESLHLGLDDVHATWQVGGKNFVSPKCSFIAPQPDRAF